jgi:hypothetical protein
MTATSTIPAGRICGVPATRTPRGVLPFSRVAGGDFVLPSRSQSGIDTSTVLSRAGLPITSISMIL